MAICYASETILNSGAISMLTDIVGYFAGICLAISFLPQVVKTIRQRSAEDISLGMLGLTLASGVGYEYYALQLQLIPVVIMNGVFVALVLLELCLKIHFDGLLVPTPKTESEN